MKIPKKTIEKKPTSNAWTNINNLPKNPANGGIPAIDNIVRVKTILNEKYFFEKLFKSRIWIRRELFSFFFVVSKIENKIIFVIKYIIK